MFNSKKSDIKSNDSLLPNESLIGNYFQNAIQLTTHRIRYEKSVSGEKFLASILLDSISMIQIKSKKQFPVLFLGIAFFISYFFLTAEGFEDIRFVLLVIGIGLIILFFFIDVTLIVLFSKGVGKISLAPMAVSKNQYMEFINAVELAMYKYKTNNYLKPKEHAEPKSGYKKEDFY